MQGEATTVKKHSKGENMKREDVLKILENPELDNDAKINQILNMRGAELNESNTRIKNLQDTLSQKENEVAQLTEKYKDYDTILNERNTLTEEKAEKARQERFSVVLGDNKPKNDYTREGLYNAFNVAIAKEENAEKTDADIFTSIIDGKETELFEGKVTINMTPHNPDVTPPTETQAYLDKMYAGNPYYKQN
jgi:hypothetical protein